MKDISVLHHIYWKCQLILQFYSNWKTNWTKCIFVHSFRTFSGLLNGNLLSYLSKNLNSFNFKMKTNFEPPQPFKTTKRSIKAIHFESGKREWTVKARTVYFQWFGWRDDWKPIKTKKVHWAPKPSETRGRFHQRFRARFSRGFFVRN